MKNELMQVWYRVTFMVTDRLGDRREYSIFCQGSSETGTAVSAVVGILNSKEELSSPTFKSIRIATYHEAEQFDAALDELADQDTEKLEEEGDE
ncbi:hypothetical protein GC087_21525 [Pantoea sp. JZ2]|uniref:hypothetical protein n=1 Tax=Pantoea sp. JZ2 TaxID=2654189 RepID=UPI002B4A2265|nr:hypothetical protein [Pantoea sp. JZ2]WRH14991.1 hypothetical protein GC087_21525 [Pantoea sp. JZ2]